MPRYRHILVPTDGSKLSERAVRTAAQLARVLGSRLTAIYVVPEGVPTLFGGDKLYGSGVLGRRYKEMMRSQATRALAVVERHAGTAGIACASVRSIAPQPWLAILRAAAANRCDLIVMASHGREGLPALALGSQTTKVLAHSRIPVLVCR
jgi:nucleotide-binding universal stress UspA family protein